MEPESPDTAHDCATRSENAARPGDAPFVIEYTYTDDLVDRFARLQVGQTRQRTLLYAGVGLLGFGALVLGSRQGYAWFGILLIALGVLAFWCRANIYRLVSKNCAESVHTGADNSARRRLIAVTEDGMAVLVGDGPVRFYRFDNLTAVQRDEDDLVAVFNGTDGVLLPRDAFTRGTAADLESFLAKF